jgi:hypothetical protein
MTQPITVPERSRLVYAAGANLGTDLYEDLDEKLSHLAP